MYICLGRSCQPVNFEGFSGSNTFLCLNVILVLQQQQNCTLCSCNSSGSFKLCEFTCYILLFRERLSRNRGKAHMTNYVESYYGLLSEPQGFSAWWKETAQKRVFFLSPSLLLNHLEPQSSKALSLLPIIPIGTTFVETAVLNCLIWPIQLLFYQCMFLCTHGTVCSTCFNCIQYSIQQKLSRYSISFSLSHRPNANMADHSFIARDELHESEASEASVFCFDNASPEKSCFVDGLVCFFRYAY